MQFEGPTAVDYENVFSLNRAFLGVIRRDPGARRCLEAMPPGLLARLLALTAHEVDRLAGTPFLLFSFRERDDAFWEPVFANRGNRDLFALPLPSASEELDRLIAAGLGFVWQLARHNPYAARIIGCASLHWCEQLTERTFLHVLALAGMQANLLVIRSATDAELWGKLLDSGVSRDRTVCRAAHISALQRILTSAAQPARTRWSQAACATRTPVLRVAEDDP